MGISVQGESRGEVAQHAGDGFDIYAVLQGQRGECVAEVMESDLGNPCPFQDTLEHIINAVRGDGANLGGWGANRAPPVAEKAR